MDVTKEPICRDLRSLSPDSFRLLTSAAISGNIVSQFNLGICHLYGQCTEVDYDAAYEWFTKAAQQGNKQSGLFLGYFNELGLGRTSNYANAISYYKSFSPSISEIDKTSISEQAKRLDENTLINKMESISQKADKLVDAIVRIKHFCIFYPKDGSYKFKWNDDTREELKKLLGEYNPLVEEYKVYLDAYHPTSNEAKLGYLTYVYEDKLSLVYDVCNALYGRETLFKYINKVDLPVIEKEPDFEYAIGRCLIDDNQSDNDKTISGICIIAGHDENSYWQNKVRLWYDNNPENRDINLSEEAIPQLVAVKEVSDDSLLGNAKIYQPFWEKYEKEQTRCYERGEEWKKQMKADSYNYSAKESEWKRREDDQRRQEEFARSEEEARRHTNSTDNSYHQPEEDKHEDSLITKIIESVKSIPKKWLWIAAAVILLVGVGDYLSKNENQKQSSDDIHFMSDQSNNQNNLRQDNGRLEFVKQFYQTNKQYIKNYITPDFLSKLQMLASQYGDENVYDYAFRANSLGQSARLVSGPSFSDTGGRIKVDYVYSFSQNGQTLQETNTVYLTITQNGENYFISDCEIIDNLATAVLQRMNNGGYYNNGY
jgi:hypothetical protein